MKRQRGIVDNIDLSEEPLKAYKPASTVKENGTAHQTEADKIAEDEKLAAKLAVKFYKYF